MSDSYLSNLAFAAGQNAAQTEIERLRGLLAAERERSERLREALDHLVDILDTFGWSTSEHLGDNSLSDINQARALLKEASDDTHA